MFSGIIATTRAVLHQRPLSAPSEGAPASDLRLTLASDPALTAHDPVVLGESIALNGVCLTVANQTPESWEFDLSAETLAKTNLGELAPGSLVNVERALKVSDRLSGHWVQGHVDGVAKLAVRRAVGECWELTFLLPYSLGRLCVEKGSIAINGTSLTVNTVVSSLTSDGVEITAMVIPHTWKHTNLSTLEVGAVVNVETDILAKYVEKLCRR